MAFNINTRDFLFGGTARQSVYKSLDAGMLRSKAIAQNISNVNSPNFNRKEVKFEEELRKAFKIKLKGANTNDNHIAISKKARIKKLKPAAYEPYDPRINSGINNVDIDTEGAKMAENQILFNYGIKFASFNKLKSAINGKVM